LDLLGKLFVWLQDKSSFPAIPLMPVLADIYEESRTQLINLVMFKGIFSSVCVKKTPTKGCFSGLESPTGLFCSGCEEPRLLLMFFS
jgi:hypothetical protein